jgi:hypothetical protein
MTESEAVAFLDKAAGKLDKWIPVPGYPAIRVKVTHQHWYVKTNDAWDRFRLMEHAVFELQLRT